MEDNNEKNAIRWINTPFSYAMQGNRYNLSQQALLLKVSNAIQEYFPSFFSSEHSRSKQDPLSLLTDEQIEAGIPPIEVTMAELGIYSDTATAREVLNKALSLKVYRQEVVNGKLTYKAYNVFSESEIAEGSTTAYIKINMNVVKETFKMNNGYITHPDDIALLAKNEKMPILYFILKKKMKNWEFNKVKITPKELRKDLGTTITDQDTGEVTVHYPRFSKLRKYVIDPTLKDLERMKNEGNIECCFTVEYDYMGRREVGDPTYIVFRIKTDEAEELSSVAKTIESKTADVNMGTTEAPKVKRGRSWSQQTIDNAWSSFLLHYTGRAKEAFEKVTKCNGYDRYHHKIRIEYTQEVQGIFSSLGLTEEEKRDIYTQLTKHFKSEVVGLLRDQPSMFA